MSTRNIHVNTASYTILVAGREKTPGEEWDVLEFSSLTELKKYRKSHPEKMAFSYSYAQPGCGYAVPPYQHCGSRSLQTVPASD